MRLVHVPVLWIKRKRPDAFLAVPLVAVGNAETQWHQFVVCRRSLVYFKFKSKFFQHTPELEAEILSGFQLFL